MMFAAKPGLLCNRTLCRKHERCRYEHNCNAKTPSEWAVIRQRAKEIQKRQEILDAQEKRDNDLLRRDRSSKIETMLEAHGLSLYDLQEWVKEIVS